MTDEPRNPTDDEDEEGADDLLPEDDKGLGLTEEFARIEAEIDAEIGRTGDPLAGDEVDESDDDDDEGLPGLPDKASISWDDTDSDEWVVPPAAEGGGAGGAEGDGGTQEWNASSDAEGAPGPDPAGEAGPTADATPAEEPPIDGDPPTIIRSGGASGEEPEPAAGEPVAAEEPASEHTVVRPQPLVPIAMAAGGGGGGEYIPDEDLVVKRPGLWWRFSAGSILIIAAVATAVSVSSLLFLTDVAAKLQPIQGIQDKIAEINPGEPQTILIVGSDKRSDTPGDPGRSDTTLLLRVDAEHGVLSLFSLPRDLKVDIAGRNYGEDKLNAAYSDGGIKKTLETVKNLTGLQINHVVNVDFQGFADAVDAIGCVYVDVDRQYQHSNDGLVGDETYSEIHVNSGYQRLCGDKALQYVRYRHTDTDFVRSARQQDFLSNARHQVPIGEVLPIIGGDTGSNLIDIFTNYTQSDIHTPAQVISVLKAFIGVKDVPIKEVHFQGSDDIENGIAYVTATPGQIKSAVNEFLGKKTPSDSTSSPTPTDTSAPAGNDKKKPKDKKKSGGDVSSDGADVISTSDLAASTGVDKVAAFGRTSARRLKFPVYVPTTLASGSTYDPGSRQYEIKDSDDNEQPAYKMVVKLSNPAVGDEYYGVEGTTWSDPPILKDDHDTVTKDGRDYGYYVGDRVNIVAFHDDEGNSYWVSNTLLQTLDAGQMIAIAESMQEAHG